MKSLYESIFDDDDKIIQNSDEIIKKQIQEYLGLSTYKFNQDVDVKLGNPVKVAIKGWITSENASSNIFKQPPMNIEYEYLHAISTFYDWYKNYIPKIKHCKKLRIDCVDYIDKIKIDRLDEIDIISSDKHLLDELGNIIEFAVKNKVKKFTYQPTGSFNFPPQYIEKLSDIDTVILDYTKLEGVKYFSSKMRLMDGYYGKDKILAEELIKYFNKPKHGRLVIKFWNRSKNNFYEIGYTGRTSSNFGIIFKKIDEPA